MDKQLIELGVSDAHLAALREQWAEVPDCSEAAGYNAVKLGLAQIRRTRTGIEKKRKALTAPLLERKKAIDGEAKRLTEELVKIENPLKDAKQHEDNRQEMIKQEKIRKEAERQQRITDKIASFNQVVLQHMSCDADGIEDGLNILRGADTSDCDERKEVADKTLAECIANLESALETKRAAEELQRRQAEIEAKEKAQREEEERQAKAAQELEDRKAEQERKEKEAEAQRQRALDEAKKESTFEPDFEPSAGVFAGAVPAPFQPAPAGDHREEAIQALATDVGLTEVQASAVIGSIIVGNVPWVNWIG